MKRPLNYYGGKEKMKDILISRVPPHITYVEGMAGGATLFFSKPPSPVEIINDNNGQIANFYVQYKENFDGLNEMIQNTLHDEWTYNKARSIYRADPRGYSKLMRAWSVWVGANMSFGGSLFEGSFQITTNINDKCHPGIRTYNKKNQFHKGSIINRLERAMILNKDVIEVIKKYNNPDTFIYLDPPYFQANQGHYKGYTDSDFRKLLDTSSVSNSKIMISCYDHPIINEYDFHVEKFQMNLGVKNGFKKVECLLTNYDLPQTNLFS